MSEGDVGLEIENYVLDSYWIEQLLLLSYDWYQLQDSLSKDQSPFFHLNPASFSHAWCKVYPQADESEQLRLQNDILLNLAGVAELRNRAISTESSGLITDKSDRLIFGPDTANTLLEVGYLAHECVKMADVIALENAWEVIWVTTTFRHVQASGERTFLLVESIEPYLIIDGEMPYHKFSG